MRPILPLLLAVMLGVLSVHSARAQTEAGPCSAPRPLTGQQERIASAVKRIEWQIGAHKLDDALALAQQWTTSNPNDAAVQAALGEVDYAMGKTQLAAASFDRALGLDHCNARAHYYSWRLEAVAGKAEAARKQLELAHQYAAGDAQIERTWEAIQLATRLEEGAGAPRVMAISPALEGFFGKTLDCGGIPVRSSAVVDSDALVLACGKVNAMLANLSEVRRELVRKGAEFHVIGEFQGTSDLPENAQFRGSAYIDAEGKSTDMDERARGVGGLKSSCGEENLLKLPGDRYWDGSDTCTHEFAHDLMDNGLGSKQRSDIQRQYKAAIGRGLWRGAYAAVNAKEYWAEISMWYFGSHGNFVPGVLTTAGPEALRGYDADGFALAERIYGRVAGP